MRCCDGRREADRRWKMRRKDQETCEGRDIMTQLFCAAPKCLNSCQQPLELNNGDGFSSLICFFYGCKLIANISWLWRWCMLSEMSKYRQGAPENTSLMIFTGWSNLFFHWKWQQLISLEWHKDWKPLDLYLSKGSKACQPLKMISLWLSLVTKALTWTLVELLPVYKQRLQLDRCSDQTQSGTNWFWQRHSAL